MIEKKYTGIAKQGADVVANPTLDGSEQALNSIRINGENFKIEGESDKLLDISKFKQLEPSDYTLVDNCLETTLTSDSQIVSIPLGFENKKIKVNLNGYKLSFALFRDMDITLNNGQEYIGVCSIYNYSRYNLSSILDEVDNAHLNFPPTDETINLLVEFNNKSNVWIVKELVVLDM